jgi:DNA-binding NarL/FixJ family response regulator
MNTAQPNEFLSEAVLLERVNAVAAHYHYGRFIQLPEVSMDARRALSQVRVALVDDTVDVIAMVGAELVVASGDCATLVYHTRQSAQELIEEIVASQPDIILMDGQLSRYVSGASIIPELAERLPHCCIIAHSGSDELNSDMLDAGAFKSIAKSASGSNMDLLAEIYDVFRAERANKAAQPSAQSDLAQEKISLSRETFDFQILMAFSVQLQCFDIIHATPNERLGMGIPEGELDEENLEAGRKDSGSSSWWLGPFGDSDVRTCMPVVLGKCPALRGFIDRLLAGPQIELTREEARQIHSEVLTALDWP